MSRGEARYTRNRPRARLNPAPVWAFLDERDISQNELERLIGISSGYLSQLMSGRAHPSPPLRRRLQRVLGVTDFDALFVIIEQGMILPFRCSTNTERRWRAGRTGVRCGCQSA